MASAKLNSLAKKLAKLGLDLEALTDMNGVPDAGKLAAAIAKLPEESRDKVVALLTKAAPKGKVPVAPAPSAPPKAASVLDDPELGTIKMTATGAILDEGKIDTLRKLAEAGKATDKQLKAIIIHDGNYSTPASAREALKALEGQTLPQLYELAGLDSPSAGEQIKVAGGAVDPEKPNDLQGRAVTPSQIAESQTRATTNNTSVDKRTGAVVDTPLGDPARQNLQKFLAKAEAADAGLLETLKEVGIDDPYAVTTIAQDKEIRKIVAERQAKAKATNVADSALTNAGKGGGRAVVPKLETTQLPGALAEATGTENLAQLLKKVPFSKLDPELQAAVNGIKTGDASLYRAWFAGHPERDAALPKGFVDGLSEEGQSLLRATSPAMSAARKGVSARNVENIADLESRIAELSGNYTSVDAANPELAKLKTMAESMRATGANDSKTVAELTKRLEKIAPSIQGPEKHAANLEQIAKQLQEMEKFGPNLQGANSEQLGARAASVAELLKSGKATEAAGKMGLAEGTTLGSMKNVTGTSFFDFLKNHPEKEVRAWAPKIKQAAAQGLGAGAEAGMLESLGAKVAAKGGVIGALGGKMNVAMMVAPLLFQLYSKMKESTEHNRQVELMQLEQAQAPTAKDLLERYRSQRFAEQGVNNMPPSPDFIRRLQSMGPQLTKSEVYIGPDRTEDNLRAMIAQSGDY